MFDASLAARGPALPAPSAHAPSGVSIRTLPAASRLSLRVKGSGDVPSEKGFAAAALALDINRCVASQERMLARLGPDEWLAIGPEAEGDALAGEIAAALAGCFHALVDVSHRSVAFAVEGRDAAAALNAGCPLDLHPSAFPAGSATRTVLGKAEIVLLRPSDADSFRVECWRSYGTYVHAFLVEASQHV